MANILSPNPTYHRINDGNYPPERTDTVFESSKLTASDPAHGRSITRTPSPTPEEYNLLNGIKPERTMKQKIIFYAVVGVLLAITIVLSIKEKDIVHDLQPASHWMTSHPAAFLIPIAILVILTFPPLMGQEIVIIARGEKIEKTNLQFGLMAYVVRKGGFLIVLMIRYSAIPSHYATSVFATIGMSFWIFFAAAVLSLPNSLVPVFVGYVMQPSVQSALFVLSIPFSSPPFSFHRSLNNGTVKTVDNVVVVLGIIVTIVAYIWVQRQLKAATPDFIYARRKARQVGGDIVPAPAGYAGARYNNDPEASPAPGYSGGAGGDMVAGGARTYTIDLSGAADSREGK
ncbi:hypothetical protein MVEN_00300900 [Mycena venus]|uniref:Uncharacterized protein n=1 Tax=Mycena venus TaxID=2733690 RepID=A0A8H6Z5L5_9AGAR|nr:hypothetical protein MVEN_00300900 [Mycena venus]